MGQRASDTRSVNFEDVRVPVENLVGGVEGKGWFNAMVAFDLSRPNVAAHATGISRAAFEYALQYADERETFGKKLHQHQAIQFMLADMKTKIEASRALTWKSAWEATTVSETQSPLLMPSALRPTWLWKSPPMLCKCLVATDIPRNILSPG